MIDKSITFESFWKFIVKSKKMIFNEILCDIGR